MSTQPIQDHEEYRDHISTVDQSGKRIWLYPKKPSGKFYNWRKIGSYLMLLFLFGIPFVKVNGKPLFLFDLLERQFILFGVQFGPQDMHLFVFALLILILFIVLFTVVFGRIFCGWVCPQTIFMEMVYRRIEYFIEGDATQQRKLDAAPWTTEKVLKKTVKQFLFFMIAVLVANTFLAWIIGVDEVYKIISEPISLHLTGFIVMLLFSFAFYFVFAKLREQVCTTICPYGRLQSVMLVEDSIVVAYDFIRGEGRGKMRKSENAVRKSDPVSKIQSLVKGIPETATKVSDVEISEETDFKVYGDCVDCGLCVKVCPTGIDIRNGTQLECVNCTACIDACDDIMDKVGLPQGLIRYDSMTGIKTGKTKLFTTRVIAYSVVLTILMGVLVFLLGSRSDVETLIFRTPGTLDIKVDETHLKNLYNYQVINKTDEEMPIEFRLMTEGGIIKLIGAPPVAKPNEVAEGALFIEMEKDALDSRKTELIIDVYSKGVKIDEAETNFFGPVK